MRKSLIALAFFAVSAAPAASPATATYNTELESMAVAALQTQLKAAQEQLARVLNTNTQPVTVDRLNVVEQEVAKISPEQLWAKAEKECDQRVEMIRKLGDFQVSFDEGPIGLSFISDQHIATNTSVMLRRMREDAQFIAATPGMYAVLAGDAVDNHIKHQGAIINSPSTPAEQWALYEFYLSIFAHRIAVVISGNHDFWTKQYAGIDVLAILTRHQKVAYAPHAAKLRIMVGNQSYLISVRHQYKMNSSMNQTHSVKQLLRFGDELFDIGVIGHHHEAALEGFLSHGLERWAARPGSYQVATSYSRQYGWNDSTPTCPTFILYPNERRIDGYIDVRRAALALQAAREQWKQQTGKTS
jgi:predicted phosphodiesterase